MHIECDSAAFIIGAASMNTEFYPLSIGAGFIAGRLVKVQKSIWSAAYIIQVGKLRHKTVL